MATEDEMVRWPCCLSGHDFVKTPGDSKGQGSLACCRPWGHKESDTSEPLNNNKVGDGKRNALLETSKVKVLVAQSYPTLYDSMDCSPRDSSFHGILQARILE